MYVCVCVYIYTYTYTYIHIHIYIYISTSWLVKFPTWMHEDFQWHLPMDFNGILLRMFTLSVGISQRIVTCPSVSRTAAPHLLFPNTYLFIVVHVLQVLCYMLEVVWFNFTLKKSPLLVLGGGAPGGRRRGRGGAAGHGVGRRPTRVPASAPARAPPAVLGIREWDGLSCVRESDYRVACFKPNAKIRRVARNCS